MVEGESVLTGENWFVENDIDGFTGNGFARWNGNTVTDGPPGGRSSIFFKIFHPATYRLIIRSWKNNTSSNLSNDCYTKLVGYDTEDVKTYQKGKKTNYWSWKTHHQPASGPSVIPSYDLTTPGIYELQISGRSKHFRIDRIVLYDESQLSKGYALSVKREESPQVPVDEYLTSFFIDAGSEGEDESIVAPNTTKSYSKTVAIAGAAPQDKIVFQTHRYSEESFSYIVPGFKPNTEHVVTVGFAEIWKPNCVVGGRVFSVHCMNNILVSDLDVFAEVGCKTAYNVSGTFFSDAGGELWIEFYKGDENPFVSFIDIEAV